MSATSVIAQEDRDVIGSSLQMDGRHLMFQRGSSIHPVIVVRYNGVIKIGCTIMDEQAWNKLKELVDNG